MIQPKLHSRFEGGVALDVLSWRLATPMLVAATAVSGGGLGTRHWILNIQVPHEYARRDVEHHVRQIARHFDLREDGVAMLTAVPVRGVLHEHEKGLDAYVTVGVRKPTWAASDAEVVNDGTEPGTINVVAFLPVRVTPGALLNALTTATEAKAQALWDVGIAGTGTASDAVCIACPLGGDEEMFLGPRSVWGSRLARAVHRAVVRGARSEWA